MTYIPHIDRRCFIIGSAAGADLALGFKRVIEAAETGAPRREAAERFERNRSR